MDDTWWKGLADLDDSQKKVMSLELDGRFLVLGPPGSGKTNLLLLRANYAVLSSCSPIAVIVFNHTLQTFIQQGGHLYEFTSGHIQTCAQLFRQLLRQEGSEVKIPEDFEEAREVLADAMSELAKKLDSPIYHTLFLDEAQDYTRKELSVLMALSKNIFIVADSRQRIYGKSNVVDEIKIAIKDPIPLDHHYRNGREICKLADALGANFSETYDAIYPSCNYDEKANPSKVDVVCASISKQVDELIIRIDSQLKAYPDAIIGIMAPSREQASAWMKHLSARGMADQINFQVRTEDGYGAFIPGRRIWLSTIHGAKGLEFRAVHLVAMDALSKAGQNQKRIAYTGITRAKTSLTIYHEQPLPPYLAGAIATASPAKGLVGLEKAFGKK